MSDLYPADVTGDPTPRKSNKKRTIIGVILGAIVMIAVFFFLFPQFADYGQAFTEIRAMNPWWIAALAVASLINIGAYPYTEIAAIPTLPYRAAFASRQAAFTISNVVPGGGAVSVATQYAILNGYRVPATQAIAAVTADGAWTYLITLAAPALAVGLLLLEGDPVNGFRLVSVVGLIIVGVSITVITVTLRSATGAQKVGRIAQRPVNKVFSIIKKPAPDVTAPFTDFHAHASEMVAERWRSITVTNLIAQFTPFLVLAVGLAGLNVLPHPVTMIEAFAAVSIALLLTMFPLTPGGLGTVDAALVALLTGFGADPSSALAADMIWRLVWFLPQILTGLLAFGVYRWDKHNLDRVSTPAV